MTQESDTTTDEISDEPSPGPATDGPLNSHEARRLVRDPTARLGGVASGLSQYTGIDPSLLRVGFVVATLFSGIGLVAYVLLWAVVPRSEYWPPLYSSSAPPATQLSNRDVFLAFAVLLGLAVLIFDGGWGVSWVVALLLVGAAVWLLNQSEGPSRQASPEPVAGWSAPVPVRVEPRRRRGLIAVLIGLVLLAVIVPIVVVVVSVLAITGGNFEIDDADFRSVRYAPADIDDIPTLIELDGGDVVVDLGQIDPDDFDPAAPIEVDINMTFGELTVLVPDDVEVDVSARAGAGDVTVFDEGSSGVRPSASVDVDDQVLELDLRVGLGEIRVDRVEVN